METSGADKNTSLFCDFSRETFQKPFSVKAVKWEEEARWA